MIIPRAGTRGAMMPYERSPVNARNARIQVKEMTEPERQMKKFRRRSMKISGSGPCAEKPGIRQAMTPETRADRSSMTARGRDPAPSSALLPRMSRTRAFLSRGIQLSEPSTWAKRRT